MESIGNQQDNFRLVFGVHSAPKDAPAKLLRQIDTAGQALAVSMQAGGHKLASIASAIGRSEGYISRMRSGKRAIPTRLVPALCAATGSNLLRQYMDLQAALEQPDPRLEIARLAGMLRSA